MASVPLFGFYHFHDRMGGGRRGGKNKTDGTAETQGGGG